MTPCIQVLYIYPNINTNKKATVLIMTIVLTRSTYTITTTLKSLLMEHTLVGSLFYPDGSLFGLALETSRFDKGL